MPIVRPLIGWAMTRLVLAVVLLSTTAACIDRSRVNARCEWNGEAVTTLDLTDRELESHLDRDVELATELAVRYADTVHGQRFGYDGHGGLIEGGDLRNRCMATLLAAVANTHDVSLDRVVAARARGRRPMIWDAMVIVLFALMYGGISWVIVRALARQFPAGDGWPALVAPSIASLGVSACGLPLFELWAMTLEMVRVGNDHLSGYRASWSPWDEHLAALYLGGILTFLAIAGFQYRRNRSGCETPGHAV